MTPSIGRICHYVPQQEREDRAEPLAAVHLAAIITAVHDKEKGIVDLVAFPPASDDRSRIVGIKIPRSEPDNDGLVPVGSWHAPEYVA